MHDPPFVVQIAPESQVPRRIDTREHYTVTWERFADRGALYFVQQAGQIVTVSTLAPGASHILRDALHVANYPCEEWPNLDL